MCHNLPLTSNISRMTFLVGLPIHNQLQGVRSFVIQDDLSVEGPTIEGQSYGGDYVITYHISIEN